MGRVNGSLNVGKGEHSSLVSQLGGTANGGTFPDHTVFYETLPANQIERMRAGLKQREASGNPPNELFR